MALTVDARVLFGLIRQATYEQLYTRNGKWKTENGKWERGKPKAENRECKVNNANPKSDFFLQC